MYRARFTVVYAVMALVLAGGAFGSYRGIETPARHHARAAAASCKAPKIGADPVATAAYFIHTAVERANPAQGYALATPALRNGTTCEQWAHGNVPVPAFLQVDWTRTAYKVEMEGTGQIVMQVMLVSKASTQVSLFLLELRQVGSEWRVGFWGPSDTAA